MNDLNSYQKRRELLCSWYDRILEQAELLQPDTDVLREKLANLRAERFVVAVCGEMNSGKSTLLNALLFGEEVLPAATTTMTAKIVLMDGASTDGIEATFYTRGEFERVLSASRKDPHAQTELSDAREAACTAGVREPDVLTEPAHVESADSLQEVVRYAAVHGKGGVYSAYVNSIQLYADRPWLHQVTVADTPGTDDPNPERDKITRKWIGRADAVVYVSFAGQAGMTNSDVKFLDENLAHVDPRRRIIAVNKCDGESNTEAIRSHINSIRSSGDPRMESLFGDDEGIVLVSGLGGLIASLQNAGRPLSDDMRFHASKLSAKGYLDPEKHGVDKLRDVIERRIIANKATNIIDSHQARLDSVFERAKRRLQTEAESLRSDLDVVDASTEERAKQRRDAYAANLAIDTLLKDARAKFKIAFEAVLNKLDETLQRVTEAVSSGTVGRLKEVGQIDQLAPQARWIVQKELHRRRATIADSLMEVTREIERFLNGAEITLSDELDRHSLGSRVTRHHLLPLSARTICRAAEASLKDALDSVLLIEIVDKATNWWQRLWDTGKGRSAGVEALTPELEEKLEQAVENFSEHSSREMKAHGERALTSMVDSFRDINERITKTLDHLENSDQSDEAKGAEISGQLDITGEKLRQVSEIYAEYTESAGG